MLEEKLNNCKTKKECLSIIKDYFSQYICKECVDDQALQHTLLYSLLLATSQLLDEKVDKKRYKKVVDSTLKEYKNIVSKRTRKIESNVNKIVKEIIRVYPMLEKFEGESGFIGELLKKMEKPEYLV